MLGSATFYVVRYTSFFTIQKISLLQASIEDKEKYQDQIFLNLQTEMNLFLGKSLFDFDLKVISEKISSLPQIKNFQVIKKWPSEISIVIDFKKTLAYLVQKNGYLPVSEEGEILPLLLLGDLDSKPFFAGDIFLKNKEVRQKAIQLLAEIPKSNPTEEKINSQQALARSQKILSQKIISEIQYKESTGFTVILSGRGTRVKMGQDHFRTKVARIQNVLDYLDGHQIQARVIDTNLTKKVLVRLRKDP